MLDPRAAALVVGLAPGTLKQLRWSGGGPPYFALSRTRVGYRRRELETWLQERRFRSTAEANAARRKRPAPRRAESASPLKTRKPASADTETGR